MLSKKNLYKTNELILSLGTNIEPRIKYLKQAVLLLGNYFDLVKVSSCYETSPVDDINQGNFYNIAVICKTNIDDPLSVLKIIQNIESKIGRIKDPNRLKGPRIIDIDIIFFGDRVIKSEKLNVPHDKFFYRKFVLVPILEILEADSEYLKKYDFKMLIDNITGQNITMIGDFKIE